MNKYIDAEALKKEIAKAPVWTALTITEKIENAPSIDIVRCKECRHREKYPCDEIEFYECNHLRLHGTKVGVKDDWFCADGERKESE